MVKAESPPLSAHLARTAGRGRGARAHLGGAAARASGAGTPRAPASARCAQQMLAAGTAHTPPLLTENYS